MNTGMKIPNICMLHTRADDDLGYREVSRDVCNRLVEDAARHVHELVFERYSGGLERGVLEQGRQRMTQGMAQQNHAIGPLTHTAVTFAPP